MGIKISEYKNMSNKAKLNVYNKPEKVYIPLIISNDDNVTVLVKKDDYVFKGSVVARRKGNFKTPIFSSISGFVLGFEEHYVTGNRKVKCVVIENDYKEKIEHGTNSIDRLNDLTKEYFIKKIKECGIVGLGGANFPTYVKYDTDKKINTLIINAVECEPYITADYIIIKEHLEQILEMIDAIVEINDIDNAYIAIKTTNKHLLDLFNKYLGMYLKIKVVLVSNLYPMGWEKNLVKEVTGLSYDKLPIEQGVVVNNISTIYAMYEALKYNKPLTERIVTFSGIGLKKPQNVLVKVGTPVKEVINYLGGINKNLDTILIAGGPMMGSACEDLIVTLDLNCVLVLENHFDNDNIECLRCGKCVNVCPSKLCPVLIKDNINNKEKLKNMNVFKCVECGLCSYICPSKINVREYVKEAKKKVGE